LELASISFTAVPGLLYSNRKEKKKKNYRITVLFQANEVKVVYACNASIPFLYLSLLEEGANKTFS
jgi:hypothetical protein